MRRGLLEQLGFFDHRATSRAFCKAIAVETESAVL